ncbi:ADP-ribosylglycohydrolase family protein [Ornithinimicrobium kibberense]|uniref:ADP-ribosylglycohydrolase family protein n=1 Tax=Ornithinimicrobium kibberense TaxID=282060 RepID=A0ABV5UZD4_9MICO|nr:ADP-ribosylglycohydrolase family protein [Ornithinimicrobium kibberense]
MHLSTVQHDRTAGVLLGQACGDALGVPYEFGTARLDPTSGPRMAGGGLGGYAPGEWSDDTQMAVAVAQVAATGADLAGDDGLEQVAAGFLRWHAHGPADIGVQTRQILADRPHHPSDRDHVALRELAADLHRRTGRTAGNGALMRTSVVGLTRLDDREATAGAARAVATLTHADPVAGDSCVLWSEAVRRAVLDGVLDVAAGLDLLPTDRRTWWAERLEEAQTRPPETFAGNGWTATALQASWSAIWHTREVGTGPDHVVAALHRAVGIGHDTDTVAAIAGGLLGARYGASALPFAWTREVHGWPGLRSRGLVSLAVRTAAGGGRGAQGWPGVPRMDDGAQRPLAAALPSDPDVLLGTIADLGRVRELGVDAVVSLCRLGQDEHAPSPVESRDHAEVWLVDSDDPASHQHLRFALVEAARAVATLRAEGRRVLLHCVAAHHRTPAVALVYLRVRGMERAAAEDEVTEALGRDAVDGLLWQEAGRD